MPFSKESPSPAPLLVVAAALVDADGRVLVQRRPEGKPMAGLWEFPGGKVEPGETPEAALIRELAEDRDMVQLSRPCGLRQRSAGRAPPDPAALRVPQVARSAPGAAWRGTALGAPA
jgi:hypothetical protein